MNTIEFERIWEDEDLFEISCYASSDVVSVTMNTYVTEEVINELSYKILQFTHRKIQEFTWESCTPDFKMKVFYSDKLGHITIEVFCEIEDGSLSDNHTCCFFIHGIESMQLERFGKRILQLKKRGVGRRICLNEEINV